MTDKQIMECKYKFQSIEKFANKPYCTLHNETCEFINFACDKNCQVYEDYKQLKAKEQECEELKYHVEFVNNTNDTFCKELNRHRQALAEIKEIAEENDELLQGYHKEWANNKIILEKTNEVLNA